MWFDGANGGAATMEVKNTTIHIDRSTYYDVPNLRDSIHKLSPNIILWGVGGEARGLVTKTDGQARPTGVTRIEVLLLSVMVCMAQRTVGSGSLASSDC